MFFTLILIDGEDLVASLAGFSAVSGNSQFSILNSFESLRDLSVVNEFAEHICIRITNSASKKEIARF
jgi:hypothetical protein